MERSAPKITAEKALTMVGVLPSFHLQPNGTNLNKLEQDLVEKLNTVPSYQSTDNRYDCIVEDIASYAL
jgi:hypothetical protein